jgi:hypothetical protein
LNISEVKLLENRRAVTVIHHPGRRGVTVTVTAAAAETDTADGHGDCQ